MRGSHFTVAILALGVVAGAIVPARADEGPSLFTGYGAIVQSRRGVGSSGHLVSIGIHSPLSMIQSGIFVSGSLDFAIDHEYRDLTHLAATGMAALGFGSEQVFAYGGVGVRFGVDGYPVSSAAIMDMGLALGLMTMLGPFGLGVEARGWLGVNFYSESWEEDGEPKIFALEPSMDFRLFLSFPLD